MAASVLRQIESVVILALYGESHEVKSVDEAIEFLASHAGDGIRKPLDRYEIEVRYNNGNVIAGKFRHKDDAVAFLRQYLPTPPQVT